MPTASVKFMVYHRDPRPDGMRPRPQDRAIALRNPLLPPRSTGFPDEPSFSAPKVRNSLAQAEGLGTERAVPRPVSAEGPKFRVRRGGHADGARCRTRVAAAVRRPGLSDLPCSPRAAPNPGASRRANESRAFGAADPVRYCPTYRAMHPNPPGASAPFRAIGALSGPRFSAGDVPPPAPCVSVRGLQPPPARSSPRPRCNPARRYAGAR